MIRPEETTTGVPTCTSCTRPSDSGTRRSVRSRLIVSGRSSWYSPGTMWISSPPAVHAATADSSVANSSDGPTRRMRGEVVVVVLGSSSGMRACDGLRVGGVNAE